jgi:hypothetical protein
VTSVPARWCISGQISLTGRGAAVMCKRLCELTAFLLFAKALAFRQHRFRRPQVRARSAQPRRDQHHQHRQQQTNDKQPHDLRCFHVLSFSSHRHHRCPRADDKSRPAPAGRGAAGGCRSNRLTAGKLSPGDLDFCNKIGTGLPNGNVRIHGESWRITGPS